MAIVAKRRYTWKRIALKYDDLIQEALQVRAKSSVTAAAESLDYDDLLQMGLSHLKYSEGFYSKR